MLVSGVCQSFYIYTSVPHVFLCVITMSNEHTTSGSVSTMHSFLDKQADKQAETDELYRGLIQVNMCRVLLSIEDSSPFLHSSEIYASCTRNVKLCKSLLESLVKCPVNLLSDDKSALYDLWKSVEIPETTLEDMYKEALQLTAKECNYCQWGCKPIWMKWKRTNTEPQGRLIDNQVFTSLFVDGGVTVDLAYERLGCIDFKPIEHNSFVKSGVFYFTPDLDSLSVSCNFIVDDGEVTNTTGFCSKLHDKFRQCAGLVTEGRVCGSRCNNYSQSNETNSGLWFCSSHDNNGYEFEFVGKKQSYDVVALVAYADHNISCQNPNCVECDDLLMKMRFEAKRNIELNSNQGRCQSKCNEMKKLLSERKNEIKTQMSHVREQKVRILRLKEEVKLLVTQKTKAQQTPPNI